MPRKTIKLAIGLSVDKAVHYAIQFLLCTAFQQGYKDAIYNLLQGTISGTWVTLFWSDLLVPKLRTYSLPSYIWWFSNPHYFQPAWHIVIPRVFVPPTYLHILISEILILVDPTSTCVSLQRPPLPLVGARGILLVTSVNGVLRDFVTLLWRTKKVIWAWFFLYPLQIFLLAQTHFLLAERKV